MRLLTLAKYDPEYAKAYREKQRAKRDAARKNGEVAPPPSPKTKPPVRALKTPVSDAVVKLDRGEELPAACSCAAPPTSATDVKWFDNPFFAKLSAEDNARFRVASVEATLKRDLTSIGVKDERQHRIIKFSNLLGERFGSPLNNAEKITVAATSKDVAYIRNGKYLGINARRLTDAETAREEQSGWFPPGTGHFEDTLVHEYAHYFLQSQGQQAWASGSRLQNAQLAASRAAREAGAPPGVLGSTISGYAKTDRYEAEADLFAFYHMGGDKRPAWVIAWGDKLHRTLGIDPTPLCFDLRWC